MILSVFFLFFYSNQAIRTTFFTRKSRQSRPDDIVTNPEDNIELEALNSTKTTSAPIIKNQDVDLNKPENGDQSNLEGTLTYQIVVAHKYYFVLLIF